MGIFKSRFAPLRESYYVFVACVFPIHVWAILNMMREVPSWILRLSTWDMLGVIAYSQLYALIEAVAIFLGLLLVSAVLPSGLFRAKFMALGGATIFLTSAWFIFLHYKDELISERQLVPLLAWVVSYVLVLGTVFFLIHRKPKLEEQINKFIQRLAVLSLLYVFIDFLSLIVIVVRNV